MQAVFAIFKAYHGRDLRLSSFTLQQALLTFYTTFQLFPPGLCSELPCVKSWSLKCGYALKRLVQPSVIPSSYFVSFAL